MGRIENERMDMRNMGDLSEEQRCTFKHVFFTKIMGVCEEQGKGIWMGRNKNLEIVGFCDADWAGDRMDRKSTTGYCTFIGGNLVTWKSKKQKVISRSSAEAEYRAMANITGELVWLKNLLHDLGVKTSEPIVLHCDNQAAIHIASNSVFHERTKHIEVDCHYIREKVQAGIILPSYTKSSDNVADIFTKATTSKGCDELHLKIGLLDLHQPILRGSVEQKLITENNQPMSKKAQAAVRDPCVPRYDPRYESQYRPRYEPQYVPRYERIDEPKEDRLTKEGSTKEDRLTKEGSVQCHVKTNI